MAMGIFLRGIVWKRATLHHTRGEYTLRSSKDIKPVFLADSGYVGVPARNAPNSALRLHGEESFRLVSTMLVRFLDLLQRAWLVRHHPN